MLLAGTESVKKNFKYYLNMVTQNETVLKITRKGKDNNIIVISEVEYLELINRKKINQY